MLQMSKILTSQGGLLRMIDMCKMGIKGPRPHGGRLVSLFNGISTLFRLLNAKPILLEEQ